MGEQTDKKKSAIKFIRRRFRLFCFVFKEYRCFPCNVSSIITKHSQHRVQIRRLVGCGTFHCVFEILDNTGESKHGTKYLVRVPRREESCAALYEADCCGYAASLFCASLGLPVPVVSPPVRTTSNTIQYFSFMEKVDGVPLSRIWTDAPFAVKKTAIEDIAEFIAKLEMQRFSKIGTLQSSDDGQTITVGPIRATVLCEAAGRDRTISFGPFDSWTLYLLELIKAVDVIFRNEFVSRNLEVCRRYLCMGRLPLDNAGHMDDTDYCLFHPDFMPWNILVDETSGHVRAVIDWDGAQLIPRAYLAGYPFELDVAVPDDSQRNRVENADLCAAYLKKLHVLGATGLIENTRRIGAFSNVPNFDDSPQTVLLVLTDACDFTGPQYALHLFKFLQRMKREGYIPEDEILYRPYCY